MTNVNTIEDKRITPPTVIMILVLYCCVVRMSARRHVCAYAFVCGTFLCRQNVCEHVVCHWKQQQSLHLVWATECAYMKHTVILNLVSEAAQRWSGTRRTPARGPIWSGRSCKKPPAETILSSIVPLTLKQTHAFFCLSSPPQLSDSIRCNYTCNKESKDPGRLCW